VFESLSNWLHKPVYEEFATPVMAVFRDRYPLTVLHVALCKPASSLFVMLFQTLNLTEMLSKSVEENPSSEAKSVSSSQETFCPLWNSKMHYRLYESQRLVSGLSEPSTVSNHILLLKTHFNTVLPPVAGSAKLSLPFIFSD
jgi:hypothetical protein